MPLQPKGLRGIVDIWETLSTKIGEVFPPFCLNIKHIAPQKAMPGQLLEMLRGREAHFFKKTAQLVRAIFGQS